MTKGKHLDIFTANREETHNTSEINEENMIPVACEQEINGENMIQSSEKESETSRNHSKSLMIMKIIKERKKTHNRSYPNH